MKRTSSDRISGVILLIPFALAIAFLYYVKGVPFDTFIFGSGSWGIGCTLKIVLYHGIVRKLQHSRSNILRVSALNGAFSGISELGAALLIFAFMPPLSIWDLVAFGVGIGAIEALLVATPSNPLKGTGLETQAAALEDVITGLPVRRRFLYGNVLPLVERLIAAALHIGTRGMVYVSYRSVNPTPFAVALLVFVLADGVIVYRLLHEGKLKDLRVLRMTYAALAFLAVLSLACFWLFWKVGH